MATKRNSETSRYRYGRCLGECSKAKAKEVQQIPVRKEFVCEECGKPLSECRRPQTAWEKYGKYVYILIALLAIAAICLFFAFGSKEEKDTKPTEPELVSTDTITVEEIIYEVKTYNDNGDLRRDSTIIGKVQAAGPKLMQVDTIEVEENIYQVNTYLFEDKLTKDSVLIGKKEKPTGPGGGNGGNGGQVTSGPKVSFGKYSGPANGLNGRIDVTGYYTLDLRNDKHEKIELQPGDVITQTQFKDGQLVSGLWQRGSVKRSFHR